MSHEDVGSVPGCSPSQGRSVKLLVLLIRFHKRSCYLDSKLCGQGLFSPLAFEHGNKKQHGLPTTFLRNPLLKMRPPLLLRDLQLLILAPYGVTASWPDAL